MKPATVVSKKHGAPRAVFIHFTGSCVGGYVPGACQQPVIPVTASTHPDAIFKAGKSEQPNNRIQDTQRKTTGLIQIPQWHKSRGTESR